MFGVWPPINTMGYDENVMYAKEGEYDVPHHLEVEVLDTYKERFI